MKTLSEVALCVLLAAFFYVECKAQPVYEKTGKINVTNPLSAGNNKVYAEKQANNKPVVYNYLCQNIKYPGSALDCCLQGTEVVQFTVLPSGELTNIKILNSVCPKIDEEITRVLNTTKGMWEPETQNSTPVEFEKEILIVFHLASFHFGTDKEYFKKKATHYYKKGNHALFELKNPSRALKYYNNGLKYCPLEDALLYARGMVKYELNDTHGAKEDWNRMKSLVIRGENENNLTLVDNFKDLNGCQEFQKINR